VTDWIADGVSCVAVLLAGASFVDGRRRGRRQEALEARVAQIEVDRRAEELRPRLVVEEVPEGRFDDYGFTVRVRSECDRALHIGVVRIVEDAAAPSALAGMVSRRGTNHVRQEEIDTPLQAHGSFKLELVRRHSLQRTDGTGRITLQVDEPGTDRSWPVTLVVTVPQLAGEAPHVDPAGNDR
jgi:hypothetical protein